MLRVPTNMLPENNRILTTMNISGSRVIHSVIVLCLPPPSV